MSNQTTSIHVVLDSADVIALFDALLEQLADVSLELRERFIGRFNALPELFCLDVDDNAALRAGTIRIGLKPSDALVELVAALRAGERDAL
jgi:hypothetical protein